MQIQITIDDEGEGVSVQGRQEQAESTRDEPDFASMSGEELSAGRATRGTTGFNPAGLPTEDFEGQGLPSQTGEPARLSEQSQGMGIGLSGAHVGSGPPSMRGTLPHQAQSQPAQPGAQDSQTEATIFLGNEF